SAVDIVTVDGHEARGLVASGNRYLDVRLEEDFEKGHVEGALNIPYYSSVTPQGYLLSSDLVWMSEKVKNPQFIEQVSSLFGKDEVFLVVSTSKLFS
ncbi:Rhodanese-like domain, partial [Musa troglodytarum]